MAKEKESDTHIGGAMNRASGPTTETAAPVPDAAAPRTPTQTPDARGDVERRPGAAVHRRTGPEDPDAPRGLLTLVCLTCGSYRYYEDTPPETVTCQRCSGTVFRSFFTATEYDEATISHLEETARSIALDEESPAISADELRDLNNP